MTRCSALLLLTWLALAGCHGTGRGEDAGQAGSAGSAPICVQTQLCVRGDHWDTETCSCVPDAVDGSGGAGGGGVCIQNVVCVTTAHFDRELCRCVPNAP